MSKTNVPLDDFVELLKKPSHNLSVPVYDENRRGPIVSTSRKNKITLVQLAEKIDNLGNDLRNEMNAGFKQINNRLDYIVSVNNLKDLPKSKSK